MWVVNVEHIEDWLRSVDEVTFDRIVAAIEILEELGPGLGRPLVDTIAGSRHGNMKELRPGSAGRSEIRVLFAFDPDRRAILLVAGDKKGQWKQWYRTNIPIADDLYDQHLAKGRRRQTDGALADSPPKKRRRSREGSDRDD